MLRLADVGKQYDTGVPRIDALRDVDLAVYAGQFVAVMGPSGSGKSTMLALAGGLTTPSAGTVFVEGVDLSRLSPAGRADLRARSVGYVFQDFNLVPTLSAAENVALPLELAGVRRRGAAAEARDALAAVGLHGLDARYPAEMSGGQRQRVSIARAIIGQRRLILADEPTGALDSHAGEAIMALLRDRADAGVAVVMVTHDARLAGWADRIVFIGDGAITDIHTADDPNSLVAPL